MAWGVASVYPFLNSSPMYGTCQDDDIGIYFVVGQVPVLYNHEG